MQLARAIEVSIEGKVKPEVK